MDAQATVVKNDLVEDRVDVAQSLGDITQEMVVAFLNKLHSGKALFFLDDEGIARHFVKEFCNLNPWEFDLAQISEAIAGIDGLSGDVPSDPGKVPKWIRKELLNLEYLPRDKLAELYGWASEDLLAIEANVADCKRALDEVKKHSPETDEDRSEKRFYNYYLKLNQTAKAEIVEVLTHDMPSKALRASYGPSSICSALTLSAPWSFRWYSPRFNHSTFSPVRHAFAALPIRELPEVQKLYELKDKRQFDEYLQKFIATTEPAKKIRCLIEQHHLLASRKSVLLPALEVYEREEFAFFAGATATQIEGIIEDSCLLSGISLDKLRQGSIREKLDHLVGDTPIYIDYVYYAFKFPILRNQIAHGRMIKDDLRRVAHLLLLDLYDTCRIVCSHPGAPNTLVELLRRVKPDVATYADVVQFAAIYAETNGEYPDDFYNLDHEFEDFTRLLDSQAVWAFLQELLVLQCEELDNGLRLIAIKLKKMVRTQRDSCVELLRGFGNRGMGEFDSGEFMAAVRRQKNHECPVKCQECG